MQAIRLSESCLHIFVKVKLQRKTNMRWNPLGVTAEKTCEFTFNNMIFVEFLLFVKENMRIHQT